MINVAVLGYGVVGSGVVEVLKKNAESISMKAGSDIAVKKILDIRDFPDSPDKDLLTKNADEVFENASIDVVVETIGGIKIAYEFTKRALKNGKHVVTSNKELVATYGPELLKLAKDNNVYYLFEASVGGGIPIIRPLNQCLAANEIIGITGILNGTTNYILTQMRKYGKNFSEALKEAQQNGYAEADPTADIEGHDACRKIAILSSIAYDEYVDYRKIPTEGISNITLDDMKCAEAMNSVIKLIGQSRKIGNKVYVRVSPAIISKDHPLANVEDVFNAIVVSGNMLGDAMFYGKGAGKLPTASAVAADIIDIARHIDVNLAKTWNVPSEDNIMNPNQVKGRFFVRVKAQNTKEAAAVINSNFSSIEWIKNINAENELAFISSENTEAEFQSALKRLNGMEVLNFIRVLE